MEVNILGMVGLCGGALMGLGGWWFGRKKARKQRGIDEVHDHIWQKARSYAWYATLVGIYFFFFLLMINIPLKTSMTLGILLFIHMGTWALSGIILTVFIHTPEYIRPVQLSIGITIILVTTITFTILTIAQSEVRYLFIGIPFALFGLLFLILSRKKSSEEE